MCCVPDSSLTSVISEFAEERHDAWLVELPGRAMGKRHTKAVASAALEQVGRLALRILIGLDNSTRLFAQGRPQQPPPAQLCFVELRPASCSHAGSHREGHATGRRRHRVGTGLRCQELGNRLIGGDCPRWPGIGRSSSAAGDCQGQQDCKDEFHGHAQRSGKHRANTASRLASRLRRARCFSIVTTSSESAAWVSDALGRALFSCLSAGRLRCGCRCW